MPVILKNNVDSVLAQAINASETAMVVATGEGTKFPALAAGEYFYATLVSAQGTREIVKVTGKSGDTLAIQRGQEGTTANGFSTGSRVEMRVTAASITDLVDEHDQAAEISIADAGGYYTSDNVEGALQEAAQASTTKYVPPGAGAVTRTVQSRLRDFVSVKDFGAVGDGVTDDTAALKAAFDYAIPLGIPVHLEGSFRVTGPIQPYVLRASGEAHIVCRGAVTITVDAASTGFRDLFYLETTAVNNCSITGGSLYIDCNSKAASAIGFRHNATSQGGQVNIECPVTIVDCYNTDASATYENQAIFVYGDYEAVLIDQPRVVGVSRAGSGGACKGISVGAFTGVVTINQPYVKNVLVGGGTFDADGIATLGKILGTTYNARGGSVRLNEPTFVDCQGRSFKSQCSDVTVMRPKVYRQNVVSISNGLDFDFQTGGTSLLVDPLFEYRLNGATSPLGASFAPVAFQQLLDNQQNVGKSIGGTILTEVLIPRYAFVIHQATALESYTEVNGLVIQPIGALTNALDRSIVEFKASEVEAKSTKTNIVVHDVRGPMGLYAIGYTNYGGGALTSKLNIEVSDCYNTLTSSTRQLFASLSGSSILAVEGFLFRENYGFRSLLPAGWTFDFNDLVTGSYFTVDIAAVSATNAPSWGASGYAYVEVLDQWFNSADQHIRVTVNNAATSNSVFFTQGGTTPTWGTIK
jgi:hypothetical protein